MPGDPGNDGGEGDAADDGTLRTASQPSQQAAGSSCPHLATAGQPMQRDNPCSHHAKRCTVCIIPHAVVQLGLRCITTSLGCCRATLL